MDLRIDTFKFLYWFILLFVGMIIPVHVHAQLWPFGSASTVKVIEKSFEAVETQIDSNTRMATRQLTKTLELVKKVNRAKYWGKYHQLKAQLAIRNHQPQQAINSYYAAVSAFEKSRDYIALSKVYLELGQVFHQQSNVQLALDYYQLGLTTLKNLPDQVLPCQVQLYLYAGICNMEMKRFPAALAVLKTGTALAKRAGLHQEQATMLYLTGQIFTIVNQDAKALNALIKARRIASEYGISIAR